MTKAVIVTDAVSKQTRMTAKWWRRSEKPCYREEKNRKTQMKKRQKKKILYGENK
jgi:hypothetical protein